jgi:uncharacterized protein YndB with AHSA1/START domain
MAVETSSGLVVTLPSDLEIVMTRVFDAPRHFVFEAMTKPEHVAHWWGCINAELPVCEIDFRVGGSWHYVMRMADGQDVSFRGVYREIVPPERFVFTECYEEPKFGNPEWLTTVTLEDLGGKTKMTHTILHKSVEARNGHLQSGMEKGAGDSMERLAEVIKRMS